MNNPSYEERQKAKQSQEDWEKIAEDADEVLVARLLLELKARVEALEGKTKLSMPYLDYWPRGCV